MEIEFLSIDPWSIAATVVNLLILFFIVKKFLLKPIHRIWEKRQSLIDGRLKNAADQEAEANELKAEYESKLAAAKETSDQMVAQAKADAQSEYDRILAQADEDASRLVSDAKKTIQLEQEKSLHEAEGKIAELAVAAAEKMLGKTASASGDQALYDQFLAQAGDDSDADGK